MRINWGIAIALCVASACGKDKNDGGGGGGDYVSKAKQSEAELNLNRLSKTLKSTHVRVGKVPTGRAGPTPAAGCCQAPGAKCTSSMWVSDPVWDELEFAISEDFYFQYSYEGTDTGFTAKAIGDLDCDGSMVTVTLEGSIVDGNVTTTIRKDGSD
jgi:hypothetical protein